MRPTSRRVFLQSSAAALAATTIPHFAIGKPGKSANGKLNMDVIGVAGMGGYALNQAAGQNLVAMCDVDDERAAKAYAKHPDVPRFKDFRVMLDKMGNELDGVMVSTPALPRSWVAASWAKPKPWSRPAPIWPPPVLSGSSPLIEMRSPPSMNLWPSPISQKPSASSQLIGKKAKPS